MAEADNAKREALKDLLKRKIAEKDLSAAEHRVMPGHFLNILCSMLAISPLF